MADVGDGVAVSVGIGEVEVCILMVIIVIDFKGLPSTINVERLGLGEY